MKRPALMIAAAFLLGLLAAGFFKGQKDVGETIKDGADLTIEGRVCRRETRQNSRAVYIKAAYIPSDKSYNSELKSLTEKQFLIYYDDDKSISVGRRIRVEGEFHWFEKARNPGNFDARSYYKSLGIGAYVYASEITELDRETDWYPELLTRIREQGSRLLYSMLDVRQASVLGAMLLGEKGSLDPEIKELYQENGIAHILAISGLHISLLGYGIFRMLRKLYLPFPAAAAVSLFLMLSYGSMTGASVSAVRALTMFLLGIMAQAAGRTYDMASALSVALVVVLTAWPGQIRQAGFLLSFGAVAGILVFLPAFRSDETGGGNGRLLAVKNSLAQGVGLQFMLFPLLIYFYSVYPLYSTLLNLILLPLMPVLFISALFGILGGLLHPVLGQLMLLPARGVLELYGWACRVSENLPFSALVTGKPGLWKLLFYYTAALVILFVCIRKKNRKLLLALPFTLLVFLIPAGSGLTVTMIDVGQGDSIYIETEEHSRILIDGGSTDIKNVGQYRMEPFLKSRGAGYLDYVIITHGDEDHVNGVLELLQKNSPIRIGRLLLPDVGGEQEALLRLQKTAVSQGISVGRISQGKELTEDELTIKCLHPMKGETAEDRNELSTVLKLNYRGFSMLFTGDLEEEGEAELLDAGLLSDVDVLKAGHHGSKGSTTEEFLKETKPETALISCGVDSRYGHPHREMTERLKKRGCAYYATARYGAITLKTEGSDYRIMTWLSDTD